MPDHLSLTHYLQRELESEHSLTARGRKKTKVVATLGPSTDDEEVLRAMYHAGLNMARFNMSHGGHEDHKRRLDAVRWMSMELERPIASMVDLQGPKIRIGKVTEEGATWAPGDEVVITTDECPDGTAKRVGCTYSDLHKDVKAGDTVLVNDGRLRLTVKQVDHRDIHLIVEIGGPVTSNKGINLPGVSVSAGPMTEKDKADLAWAIENDVDYIALSFVSSAQDIHNLRRRIRECGRDIPIIAKIEREEAVRNMEDIIRTADGIMVARGDLGIEMSTERLPVIQKHLIRRASAHGTLVITATQMLESMIESPIPTRAETSDVANAIFDGTDAIMLSGETAVGKYPVEAVQEMLRISVSAEVSHYLPKASVLPDLLPIDELTFAVTTAAAQLAETIKAAGVMTFSHSTQKPDLLSKLRFPGLTISMCYDDVTWRRLSPLWGTAALRVNFTEDPMDLLEAGLTEALRHGVVSEGDTIVVLTGFGATSGGAIRVVKV